MNSYVIIKFFLTYDSESLWCGYYYGLNWVGRDWSLSYLVVQYSMVHIGYYTDRRYRLLVTPPVPDTTQRHAGVFI